jgi:serine/threonine protein phosphatase 1
MKTLVIGDIHGNFKALEAVLLLSNYDPKIDRLICIGDYVDGYPDSYKVVEKLINLNIEADGRNIYLLGNHDEWTRNIFRESLIEFQTGQSDYISTRYAYMWTQGGKNTYLSYLNQIDPLPDYNKHLEFFNNLKPFHIENNNLFVHAGWDVSVYPDFRVAASIDPDMIIWDRTLINRATHIQYLLNKDYPITDANKIYGGFDTIYIGHTAVDEPFQKQFPNLRVCNVVNIDTGAGHRGKLTAYRLEDNFIFQSEMADQYYLDHRPRY